MIAYGVRRMRAGCARSFGKSAQQPHRRLWWLQVGVNIRGVEPSRLAVGSRLLVGDSDGSSWESLGGWGVGW